MVLVMRGVQLFILISLFLPGIATTASINEEEVRCMALNLYWEARSEGDNGMLAVGWVVLNRMAYAKYPNTVCEVISQGGTTPPCEWSWRCDGRSDAPTEPTSWAQAQELARRLLQEPPADPTHGALWFHHESLKPAKWLQSRAFTAHIGKHLFYK
jgi:spore germination cell wall hydrolase CwlJ-like protein